MSQTTEPTTCDCGEPATECAVNLPRPMCVACADAHDDAAREADEREWHDTADLYER